MGCGTSLKVRENNYENLLHDTLNAGLNYSVVKPLLLENKNTVFRGGAVTGKLWGDACEDTHVPYHLFRAINPGIMFPDVNRAGIVVGNEEFLNENRSLYKHAFDQYNIVHKLPTARDINVDANILVDVDDSTFITEVKFIARRNLAIFPLLTGANGKEDLIDIYEKMVHAFLTLPEPYKWDSQNFTCYGTLKQASKKKFNKYCKQHGIERPTDMYYKAAGCNRWWPHGRGRGYHLDSVHRASQWKVDINEREHLKITYTNHGDSAKKNFHLFYKGLNAIHKRFKVLGYGGFWKDSEFGYISVDPQHFGTMFTVEVRCIANNLLVDYTIEEVIKAGKELGMVMKHIPNMTDDRCAGTTLVVSLVHPEGHSEAETFKLLLERLNVFRFVERDSIYQRRRHPDDTILFNSSIEVNAFGGRMMKGKSSLSDSRSQSVSTGASS